MTFDLIDYPSAITQESIQFFTSSKQEAFSLLDNRFFELATIVQTGRFSAVTLRYPECVHPLKITAKQARKYLTMPQNLNFGKCEIPYELLRYVYQMGESDSSQGLVRIVDNRQIVLSERSRIFTPNLETMMTRTRADYWYAPDLEEFNRDWQRELSPDGSNWFTKTYRVFDSDNPENRDGWKEFTSRYRLLLDDRGAAYHIGENLNVREIAAPVPL